MKKLYLIRGVSQSGKTTKAQQLRASLEKTSPVVWAENDQMFLQAGKKYIFDQQAMQAAIASCYHKIYCGMAEGMTCIVSNMFLTFESMVPYLDLAVAHEYQVTIIEMGKAKAPSRAGGKEIMTPLKDMRHKFQGAYAKVITNFRPKEVERVKWFTSDTHFGHKGILKWGQETRGVFSSTEEHDAALVAAINGCVDKEDDLYILGDFAFLKPKAAAAILSQLNGRKHLIVGNHDSDGICKLPQWASVSTIKHVKLLGRLPVVLSHFPLEVWEGQHRGWGHLHGHCHGKLPRSLPRRHDVGLDSQLVAGAFRPLTEEELYHTLNGVAVESQDGHEVGEKFPQF